MRTPNSQIIPLSSQQVSSAFSLLVSFITILLLVAEVYVELTLHSSSLNFKPKAWLSADYDDNVFYEADLEPTGNVPNQGAVLKVGGGLTIENRGKSPVGLDVNALSHIGTTLF